MSAPEQLAEAFDVDEVKADNQGQRFNVAPTLDVYSIIERDDHRRLGTMRWGFLPHWTKKLKGTRSPINARIEEIDGSRMFATAFERRRCLIPADGFYEWQEREGSSRKQPWFIHDPESHPLAFAGIWTLWSDRSDPDAERIASCAIVTTSAVGEMQRLHERMPVILPTTMQALWLTATPEDSPHLLRAIQAMTPPPLRAHTISDRVNNVRNDAPDLVEEAPPLPE